MSVPWIVWYIYITSNSSTIIVWHWILIIPYYYLYLSIWDTINLEAPAGRFFPRLGRNSTNVKNEFGNPTLFPVSPCPKNSTRFVVLLFCCLVVCGLFVVLLGKLSEKTHLLMKNVQENVCYATSRLQNQNKCNQPLKMPRPPGPQHYQRRGFTL